MTEKLPTKSEIEDAVQQFRAAWDRLMELSDHYPSLIIYDAQEKFGESWGAFMEQKDPLISFICKQSNKYAALVPQQRRKEKAKNGKKGNK